MCTKFMCVWCDVWYDDRLDQHPSAGNDEPGRIRKEEFHMNSISYSDVA